MVEKRTLIFLTLATLVWAISMSSLAGYFYLQNTAHLKQIAENQESLNKVSSTYDKLMTKYNVLLSEYSVLYSDYSSHQGGAFTLLIGSFSRLMDNLKGNYSSILMNQEDLNETCYRLEKACEKIYREGNVTEEDFGRLLNDYYDLFNLLAIRELNIAVSETVTLNVSICINYGNDTEEWHNKTSAPAGFSLFQLTQSVATINPEYYPEMKPGHILLKSINGIEERTDYNFEEGYSERHFWIWYYWDPDKQDWGWGPVGCDAWMLKDGGVYKWSFEYWRWYP